ncbi:MAG: amidohydrolase family protein [Flavobacteriaceae bacterium]|nr:amidohydrolase family protein [Flavobacteriaceae bacterium]
MLRKYLIFSMLLCSLMMFSQEHFPKNDGVKTTDNIHMAFTNAKIYVTPTQVIENGTLLLKNGKVVNAASSVSIPADAVTIDLAGKSIYPSFIDVFSAYGVEKPKRAQGGGRSPQYDATRQGFYWNDHIMPENNAIEKFKYDDKAASDLRKAGFGVVNTHIQDGIARGSGALIALNGKGNNSDRIIEDRSAQYFSLRKSVASRQSYPGSVMGSMALLRQVKFDADWYAGGNANVTDRSLEAYIANKNMVNIIHAGDKVNALRVDKVGDEIGTQYVIVGGGDEYEWVKDIKATNAKYIIPINFPKAYDVENPFLASSLELESMREWNQKPFNPKVLADNGVTFALTMHDLKTSKDFKSNLMKAIDHGLDKTKALEALTTVPAQILGKSNAIGSLRAGSWANFLITSGDIFDKETTLYENWVQGKKHVIEDISVKDIRGDYELNLAGKTYDLSITGSPSKPKAEVKTGEQKLGSKLSYKDDWMNLTLTTPDTTKQEFIRLASHIKKVGNMSGKAVLSNGTETSFYAKKTGDAKSSDKKKDEKKDMPKMLPLTYPNGAYGFTSQPRQETILFQNATVWTNENEGVLENTDVLIKNGKISKIGKNLSTSGAKVVDATGKHVTSGIIDEHSHIAASSINEGGQNSSAEVSIEDVIDAEDVDIYRNLAGGVTSMQILHGSANPIGGRSAIIKLKWGASPQEMIYNNSPKFIKFALGENVKQSNWQSFGRFPQTRMGVEQLYVDYFSRAKEYDALKKSGKPYRKDTELEVLAEILNKERFISCHSYVQSEINMLMKVAEQFNFNINTFTHILEGYKVADKMKEHGVGGSTFSDWWAYKYEVNDAIPHNAAIMHNQGVVTAINSDDGEMSRRLNQEAAKSVKYGGVSEEDAWKFVTLNPAKLLHLDNRVGSLKVGKDADVVLWSGHPMSVYSKAEKTLIEGTVYFDLERDKQLRDAIKKERSELMTMMMKEKNNGLKTQPIKKKESEHLHCNSL